jgi:lysophospholipase L1-like esterase
VAAAVTLLVTLSACSFGSSSDGPAPTAAPAPSPPPSAAVDPSAYIALGDSVTAGPGIEPQQDDAGLCQRSAQNWPTLLAATARLDLTDVSCSGATTADLAGTVASGVVTPGVGMVTVSAGGNDGGLFLSLIRACTAGSEACTTFADRQAPPILRQTSTDLATLLQTVKTDAPGAEVALVGYPRIMPTSGTCETVGIAAADVASVVSAEEALDAALAAAAERAGVQYVSPFEASAGHDACSGDQAWTNGASPAAGDGIFFHPNHRGMRAIADLVAASVKR